MNTRHSLQGCNDSPPCRELTRLILRIGVNRVLVGIVMETLISDEIRAWIGRSDVPQTIEITRRDIIKYAVATEQHLAKYLAGDEAPPMFLFGAHSPATLPSLLGEDGLLPDPLLPDLPLKRVMAGGISQQHTRPVRPGDVVVITRRIADIYEKAGTSGPLIFVDYEIIVRTVAGDPIMVESQVRIVR